MLSYRRVVGISRCTIFIPFQYNGIVTSIILVLYNTSIVSKSNTSRKSLCSCNTLSSVKSYKLII
nr:MAG TPA: hypothetical protein [Bacteriophage sp.]